MKNFLKILGITTLAQMILWLLLIGGDYIQENISYNVGDRVYTFGIVVLPVIYAIIYIICYKNKTQKIKQFISTAGIWIVENLIIFVWIWLLIEARAWFIEQGAEILNGIEYFIFPIYWTINPIIIILSWKLISYIYHKIKK